MAFPKTVLLATAGLLFSGCGGRGGDEPLQAQYERAVRTADPELSIGQLLEVASRQHQAGDARGVSRSLTAAVDAVPRIADVAGRAAALNRIAPAQARMQGGSAAGTTLRQLERLLDQLDDLATRVTLTSRAAQTIARDVNDVSQAAAWLQRAETLAGQIEQPEGRIDARLEIATAWFHIGQRGSAADLLDSLRVSARELANVRRRADALANLAATLSATQRGEDAEAVFQESRQAANEIADPLSQAHARLHLGTRLSAGGRRDLARAVLQEAEQAAEQVADPGLRRPLIDRIREVSR